MARLRLLSLLLLVSLLWLAGCASRPVNPPITQTDPRTGYRFEARQAASTNSKENLVILAFSGGGTRAAAFIASGSMAYAYFKVHQPNALWPMQNGGEAAAMFSWTLLLLVFTGSGAFGLDRLFAKRATTQDKAAAEQTPVAA